MGGVTAEYPSDTVLRALAASPASVVSIYVKTPRSDDRESVRDALVEVIHASRGRSQPLESITVSSEGVVPFVRFAQALDGLHGLQRLTLR
eukprot:1889181-Rhodomonas_salina.1